MSTHVGAMLVVLVESAVLLLVSSFFWVLIGFGHYREGSSFICIRTYSIGIIRGVKLVNFGFLSGSSFFFPMVCPTLHVSFFLSWLLLIPSSVFLFPSIFFASSASSAFMYFWAFRSNFVSTFGGLLVIKKKINPQVAILLGKLLGWLDLQLRLPAVAPY